MEFKPLGDKILVQPDPQKEKTSGGLILADTAKTKSIRGTIIKIGNETEFKFETRPGDKVIYGEYSGSEMVDSKGDTYLIMREDELFSLII